MHKGLYIEYVSIPSMEAMHLKPRLTVSCICVMNADVYSVTILSNSLRKGREEFIALKLYF